MRAASIAAFLTLFLMQLEAIEMGLIMKIGEIKCMDELIPSNTLLTILIDSPTEIVCALDLVPENQRLFESTTTTQVRTALNTPTKGTYRLCVKRVGHAEGVPVVTLAWGAEAKDYSRVARLGHIAQFSDILRSLTNQVDSYHNVALAMGDSERHNRAVTDNTALRVMLFAIASIAIIVFSAAMQSYYFQNFVLSKKIV